MILNSSCGLSLFLIPPLTSVPFLAFLVPSVVLVGKLCISAVFTVIYVHSSEVFPTTVRNTGMGVVAVASRYVELKVELCMLVAIARYFYGFWMSERLL